jgi:succinoglycan biosynthesis transport protein ExoP
VAQVPQDTDTVGAARPEPPSNLRLLQIAWRRKWLILLGLVVAGVAGVLYYVQAAPVYESKAQVLVIKKTPETVMGLESRLMSFEDYMSTHQMLVKSTVIIDAAIRKHQLDTLSSVAGQRDTPVEVIGKALTVSRNKGASGTNNILDLSYRCRSADDAVTILDAVIESYREFVEKKYKDMGDVTLNELRDTRDRLEKDLGKYNADHLAFLEKAPLLWASEDGSHVRRDRLAELEEKRSAVVVRRVDLQSELETLQKARKEGADRALLLAMAAGFSGKADGDDSRRTTAVASQEQLFPLLDEEQRLLEKFGPNHPQVQAVRKRIEMARKFFSDPAAPWRATGDQPGKEVAAADPLDVYERYLSEQLHRYQKAEQMLAELYDKEAEEVRRLKSYASQEDDFKAHRKRLDENYASIIKSLTGAGMVRAVGGFEASTVSPPVLGKKVAPSALLVFPLAALVGLLGGCGLASLAELTDRSFRTPEEIRRRLGLPVVGLIPQLRPADETVQAAAGGGPLHPMLCSHYRSRSREAEAYRGVRTSLYFSTNGEGHKVIQITSPNPQDGKSTLTANLALSIAQSGKRILLIDADLRKPQVHKLFGLSGDTGLVSIITGEADPGEVICPSSVPGLSLLPCGPVPSNPAELLTAPRFKELLDVLREQFDFVLIDTPPLLAVTDPSVVAPRVDGVLLTLRLTKNGRPSAERAKEMLDTLGANVLGVVVNGIDRNGSGSYGYGYGYGGYGYGSEKYHEEAAQPAVVRNGQPQA